MFKIIHTYKAIFSAISGINWTAFIIAIIVCLVIQLVKDCINERCVEFTTEEGCACGVKS